jgi:hypothetical protein
MRYLRFALAVLGSIWWVERWCTRRRCFCATLRHGDAARRFVTPLRRHNVALPQGERIENPPCGRNHSLSSVGHDLGFFACGRPAPDVGERVSRGSRTCLDQGHPCHRRGRLVQADSDYQGWSARINDVLTVTKIRLFTETEISRPNVVEDGDEPALSRETHHRWHQRRLLGIVVRPPQVVRRCDIKPATGLSRCIAFPSCAECCLEQPLHLAPQPSNRCRYGPPVGVSS